MKTVCLKFVYVLNLFKNALLQKIYSPLISRSIQGNTSQKLIHSLSHDHKATSVEFFLIIYSNHSNLKREEEEF